MKITPQIELLNMDCMDYLKGCEDLAFDLAITSPPYNLNLRINSKGDGYVSRQVVPHEFSTKYRSSPDNLPMDDYYAFISASLRELLRTSRLVFFNVQIATGNKPALMRVLGEFAYQVKKVIIWDKGGQPAMRDGVLNSAHELILVFSDDAIARRFDQANFPRGGLDNLWRMGRSDYRGCGHGATFPLALPQTVLSNFARPGQRVLDPFMGMGTTAIAAHYYGCEFVGIELDPDYYAAAVERFNNETAQVAMF